MKNERIVVANLKSIWLHLKIPFENRYKNSVLLSLIFHHSSFIPADNMQDLN